MFEKKDSFNLKELLQDNYTDFDIIREKPMVFKVGDVMIICAPAMAKDSPLFLKQMSHLILEYYEIFENLEFLASHNFRDKNIVKDLIDKVTVFTASKKYSRFIKDAIDFIYEWGYTVKGKGKKVVRIKSRPKRILNNFHADEILYMLFVLFVYNYELEKKNCLEFLKIFELQEPREKSSVLTGNLKTQKERVVMPKFSTKPYNKETLDIFAKQSTT